MDGSYDASRGGSRADVFVSTFVAGRLAFQVLSLRLGPEHAQRGRIELLQNPGPWDETTLQVWPVSSANLTWPPASSFTDGEGVSSIFTWEQRWASTGLSGHQQIGSDLRQRGFTRVIVDLR